MRRGRNQCGASGGRKFFGDSDSDSGSDSDKGKKARRRRPVPSPFYLGEAEREPSTVPDPKALLVILDLNGTLLHRLKNKDHYEFVPRPGVEEFLEYVFSAHKVMIWASATPPAVDAMCSRLLTAAQRDALVATWSRAELRLHARAYARKTPVYKQLSWVWADEDIQSERPDPGQRWSQRNTVLVDDNTDKAVSEPYSIVPLESFDGKRDDDQGLVRLRQYLERLKMEHNVSSFMRVHPYRAGRAGAAAAGRTSVSPAGKRRLLPV